MPARPVDEPEARGRERAGLRADVREVLHAATSRAQAVQDAANGLAELPAFTTWGGEAAEAAREAISKTRADLDAHGREAQAVANAARSAADEIERIRSELATLKADAAALDMEIDPVSGRVVAGAGFRGNPMELLLKQQQLQPRVDALIAEANLVDVALASAIDMASGATPIPPGQTPGGANASEPADGAAGTPKQILAGAATDPAQPQNLDEALTEVAGQPVPLTLLLKSGRASLTVMQTGKTPRDSRHWLMRSTVCKT
ncbi:MAG: hypothetical protein K0R68_3728 [Mycobacterium sp.]|nr:hypothetical protein [Mycobacterium sp.]